MAVVVAGWVAGCFVGLGRASGLSHGRVVVVDSMPSFSAVSKYYETHICLLAMIAGLCYALVRNTVG